MVDERESITAKLCAFARAWHSYYSREKIYDDYLAFDFMGKEEYEEMLEMIKEGLIDSERLEKENAEKVIADYFLPIPLSRMHFNENGLAEFAKENGKIQYVICGAGADTFSFRNDNDDIEVFAETLRQIAELSLVGSKVVFDYPLSSGHYPDRVKRLEEITESLGEVMCGGFDSNEMRCVLCSLGFKLDVQMDPKQIQETYFEGRSDGLKAFENVSLVSATYVNKRFVADRMAV